MPTEQLKESAVTLEDVQAAQARIRAVVHETPVLTSRLVDERCGAEVFFKCENLQRGGAFKIRGAMNFLLSLTPDERRRGVVAFSSGNHAQAVAIAASHLGMAATIVMPTDAPKAKRASTEAYGPKIVPYDRLSGNREAIAAKIAEETGAIVVPAYDHPWIIAGQATAALELLSQQPELDAVAVPLGGGGLLAGTLIAAKSRHRRLRVFGVEPALADDWQQSLQAHEKVEIPSPSTIADGLRTTKPGNITFPIVQAEVEGVVPVSEEEIKEAVRILLTRMKLLTEPSGAVGAAAVLHKKLPSAVRRVGVILSGGNVDFDLLAEICRGAA